MRRSSSLRPAAPSASLVGPAAGARADVGRRAEGRAPPPAGSPQRHDLERGHGAEPVRRHQPHLSAGSGPSSRRPGLTAIDDVEEARRALLEDSLRGLDLVRREEGPVVDVGSGGGAPGHPARLTPCRSASSSCSRRTGASATSSRGFAPRMCASCRAAPRSRRRTGPGVRWPRRSRRRRLPRSGACRSSAPVGPWSSGSGRLPTGGRGVRRRADRRAAGGEPAGLPRPAQARPDAGGFPTRIGVARKRPLA